MYIHCPPVVTMGNCSSMGNRTVLNIYNQYKFVELIVIVNITKRTVTSLLDTIT